MNPFRKRLDWLYQFWGLDNPDIPVYFDSTSPVVPVHDIGADGWGVDNPGFTSTETSRAQSTAAGTVVVISADQELHRYVSGVYVDHNAASGNYRLEMVSRNAQRHVVDENSTGLNTDILWFQWQTFRGGVLMVPAGWTFEIVFPATGVGETIIARTAHVGVSIGGRPHLR